MSETFIDLQNKVRKELDGRLTARDMLRIDMLSSLETYTKVMFKAQYGHKFLVNSHHKLMFQALQDVIDGKCTRLMINMPPRYSKTEVAIKNFASYGFALNPKCKFLHLSYSDTLVADNSQTVQMALKQPLYKDLFPDSALRNENKPSSIKWKTLSGGEFYAVPTKGQVTGFGAGNLEDIDEDENYTTMDDIKYESYIDELLGFVGAKEHVFQGAVLIDDPLKPEDALSDTIREKINNRFETTIRNRVNSRNTPIIIIMQRLHEHDLCGYLLEAEPDKWTVLSLPAICHDKYGAEEALWPTKHTLEELHHLRDLDPVNFDTQYMQDPTPTCNLMYSEGFQTYEPSQLPSTSQKTYAINGEGNQQQVNMIYAQRPVACNYVDTADTGADKYCSIFFIDTPNTVYITDVLFTDKPMEYTEGEEARRIIRNRTERILIEGNNGGRVHSNNVKQQLRNNKYFKGIVKSFHQTDNKFTRIFMNAAGVMNDVLMPLGWESKWPEFNKQITTYRKDVNKKSIHDDAPDALTGVYEMHIHKAFKHGGIRKVNR
jgi:predicted phage terminase large subunit-like protein